MSSFIRKQNKKDRYNWHKMRERIKRSERNVKRQKDVNYSNTEWVKRLRGKKELLSDAQDYKYKYCC